MKRENILKNLKSDIPAGVVVFFVALPLCLGIALASGAPLFAGIIAGIVGGLVVGSISGSSIGVSGPAAGLAAIVLTSIGTLGGFENFLVAVVLAGFIQLFFGFLRAGVIGYYFPSSVIKGMLTGIGIIIILKQLPHFVGYHAGLDGDLAFLEEDGHNTFTELFGMLSSITPGSLLVGIISLAILIFWDSVLSKKGKFFRVVQGPLVAVVFGILFYAISGSSETYAIAESHLVSVPVPEDFGSFLSQFTFPNFAAITDMNVWVVAFTIALVASLETLLCVEATDKLDPDKNITPTNRELLAQGTGNILSGLIGGIPITQVIVRSSANIQSGGKTKISAIFHSVLLLLSVIAIPNILNMIPLSVLAAILLVVGYKLAKPSLFKEMYLKGWTQSVPFFITILGIIFTDLLVGIGLGLGVGIIVILLKSYQNSHFLHMDDEASERSIVKMTLAEEVTFINKGAILNALSNIAEGVCLELNVTNTQYIDSDVIEIFDDFALNSKTKNISVRLIIGEDVIQNPTNYNNYFKNRTPRAFFKNVSHGIK